MPGSRSPEALLFGSLLTVDAATATTLAIVAVLVAALAWMLAGRWLAAGFDSATAKHTGSARSDVALLACVALAAGAALPVTGALLAGALLIVPAATARMLTDRARRMPALSFALAALIGSGGLYCSLNFDLPTGAAIAAVAGACFFVVAGARAAIERSAGSRRVPALAAAALTAMLLAGCGGGTTDNSGSDGKLDVVATTPQIADIVRQVGGEAVDVSALLPAGADPHEYEPKPSAISALGGADVIFRSGGDIDEWLLPAVKAASPSSAPVDLSRAAVLLEGEEANGVNAHWYLSPENVARAAQKVRDTLVKADPSARETFRANTTAYMNEIDAAREKLTACVAKVPAGGRALATGHDDFAYLADSFDLKIVAQLAETGESQPSASELQKAVDAARSGGAKALVASRGEVTHLEQQVASKLGIPLLQLYADNLTTGDDASTLLGAIGYDVDRIVDAVSDGSVKCPATQ
ncbi:MAG: zinc ABC transporter substrate-binding protein [Solirubrobacterales bacterium]